MMEVLEILLWCGAVLWTILFVQGTINALLVRDVSRIRLADPAKWPFVSFVVPARNEEAGIRDAVTSFCKQNYPAFEVIVVNDRSTDRTGKILSELQAQYPNLTVVQGEDPPEGWLGKPNALQRGLMHAKGDWILMADADSLLAPDLLQRAVSHGLNEDAGMVVVRPRHITKGILEAVLMSGVNFFFFVATPMFLVSHSKSALFATGSPVFNLIRRDALRGCGEFACLKQAVVDDLEIGFQVKRAGYRLAVTFSGEWTGHRMYPGARQTVQGFGKTTYPTIRQAPYFLPLYMLVAVVGSFLPYYGLAASLFAGQVSVPAVIALVMMHAVFAGIAWRYREPWYITFLNPLRELGWLWIFTRSFVLYYRKGLVWRGRSYPASS